MSPLSQEKRTPPEPPADVEASLSGHLRFLHARLAEIAPAIDRIAVALYDPAEDMLRTFINSTPRGFVIRGYQYPLSQSESLSHIARTGEPRLIEDIPATVNTSTAHSAYIVNEGFHSSYTLRLSAQGQLLGILFFDSRASGVFTPEVQRELQLYAQLVAAAVSGELLAVRSVLGAVHLAWEMASLRDVETGEHLARMARISRIIARALIEPLDLADEFVEAVYLFAPLHDIGKIGIPDRVLLKPGPLDEADWEIMRSHVEKGDAMVTAIISDLGLPKLNREDVLRNVVRAHHEKLDGSGYPRGLSGDDVPLEARIVTVADIFDALTSDRRYKPAWPVPEALAELHRLVDDGKIDARCVQALEDNLAEVTDVMQRYGDTDMPKARR